VIQADGADRCEIPLSGAIPLWSAPEQLPLGFVSGAMFAIAAGGPQERKLHSYSTSCKLVRSAVVPADFEAAAISPEGEYLALVSKDRALITGAGGETSSFSSRANERTTTSARETARLRYPSVIMLSQ